MLLIANVVQDSNWEETAPPCMLGHRDDFHSAAMSAAILAAQNPQLTCNQ